MLGPSPACLTCQGTGSISVGNQPYTCPNCDGTGKKYVPGREIWYELGPFTLSAYAAAQPQNNQNSSGLASVQPSIQGVSCQITNKAFRWMFVVGKSTFPYAIQPSDAGSGGGRYFTPQQTYVSSENFIGDGKNPMPLPTPYTFVPNQNFTANVQDLHGGTGLCSVTNGSPDVTWVSGTWGAALNNGFNTSQAFGPPFPGVPVWNGATIIIGGVAYVISNALGSGVTSQTTLVLASNYLGATNASIAYAVPNTIRLGLKGQELSQ